LSRKPILVFLAFCWIAAIIAGSLMPNGGKALLGIEPHGNQGISPQIASNHKLVHYAAFGSTTLLLLLLARNRKQEIGALAITIVLGFCLEAGEHVFYHSPFEYSDVFDDAVAALLTCAAYWLFSLSKWPRRQSTRSQSR
jgi:hypothetical protein